MPYSNNAALPDAVKKAYSATCQGVFREVFNREHGKNGNDESDAFRAAHGAAKACERNRSKS